MESVYEVIPKECLPVEYGGTLGTIPDMLSKFDRFGLTSCIAVFVSGKWDKAIEDHHDFFVENFENVSVEHLRPLESKADEPFGMDGTFKKLAID
jgi:hypothetical protein